MIDDKDATGPGSGGDRPDATGPGEAADGEKVDPGRTPVEEPESGAGYGNHAMPDLPA